MTERDFLRGLQVVCLVAILSIVGGTLYVLRKIDHLHANIDAMARESEAEIARLRARIEEARKTAPSASSSAGKPGG